MTGIKEIYFQTRSFSMQRTVKWPHALAVGLTKIHSTSNFLCFKKIELAQSHHYEQTDSMDKKIIRDLFQNLFTV